MLVRSDMNPMTAGRVAEPIIDITSNDEARFVYGPRFFRLSANMVGNMIELKKPANTTAQIAAMVDLLSATTTHRNPPAAKTDNSLGAATYFMIADPVNRPSIKPNRCS